MSKKQNKTINWHFIIRTIVVLAIVATAGYFIWSYLSKLGQDALNNSGTSKNNVSVDLITEVSDKTHGSKLALKYPKEWKLTNEGEFEWMIKKYPEIEVDKSTEATPNPDNATITSPDGKVSVIFDVGNRTAADECDAASSDIVLSKIETESMPNLDDYVFAIKVYGDKSGVYYDYSIGVFKKDSWANSAKVGDQHCITGSMGIPFNGTAYDAIVIAEIMLNDVENGVATTLDEVNKMINTDNFNIAKQIVQSLYIKK
jgi:hypothetical protein